MSRLSAPNLGIPSLGQHGGGPSRQSELGTSWASGGGPTGYGATGGIAGMRSGDQRGMLGAGGSGPDARWDNVPMQTSHRPSAPAAMQVRRSQVDQQLVAGLGGFGGTRLSRVGEQQSSVGVYAQHPSQTGWAGDGPPGSSDSCDGASEASESAPSQASSARTAGSGRMGGAESDGSDYTPWPPPRHSTRPSAAGAVERLPRQSTMSVQPSLQGRSSTLLGLDRMQQADGHHALEAGGYQRPSIARQPQTDLGNVHQSDWSRQSLAARPCMHESEHVGVPARTAPRQSYTEHPAGSTNPCGAQDWAARPSVLARGVSGPCMSENGQGMMEVNLIDDDEESPSHGQATTLAPPSSWTSPAATTLAASDASAQWVRGGESFNGDASNACGSAVTNSRPSVMTGGFAQRQSFHAERQPHSDEVQLHHGLQPTIQDGTYTRASLLSGEVARRAEQQPYHDQQHPFPEEHQQFHDTRQPWDMEQTLPLEFHEQEQLNGYIDEHLVSRGTAELHVQSESFTPALTSMPMPFEDRPDRNLEHGNHEPASHPRRQHGSHHDAAMAAASAAMAVAPQPGAMAAFAASRPHGTIGSAGSGHGLTQALSSYGPPSEWWHDSIILGRLSALALRYCATKSMRRPWLGWKKYVMGRREKMLTMLMFRKRVALKVWRWRSLTKGRYKNKLPLVRVLARLPCTILRPAWARLRQAVFMRRDLSRRLALLHLIERRMLDQIALSHYYHRLLRLGLASLWLATQINPSNEKLQPAATPRTEAPRSHVEQVVRRVWRRWHFATNMWLSSAEYRVRETEAWLAGECRTPRAIATTSAAQAPLTPEGHFASAWGDVCQSSMAGAHFETMHFDPRQEDERGGIDFEAPVDISLAGEAQSSFELPFPEAQVAEGNHLGRVHLSPNGQQAAPRATQKSRVSPAPRQVTSLHIEDQVTEPPQRTPQRPSPGPSQTSSSSSSLRGPQGGARGFGTSSHFRESCNRGSVDEMVFVEPEDSDAEPADDVQGTLDPSVKLIGSGPPNVHAAAGGPARRPAPVADLNDDYRSLRRSIAPRGPAAGRQVFLRQR